MSNELIKSIQRVSENVLSSKGLTDMVTGTVTSINPLEVTILNNQLPIPQEALVLTESVVEKKIVIQGHTHPLPPLAHSHDFSGSTDSYTGETEPAAVGDTTHSHEFTVPPLSVEGSTDTALDGDEDSTTLIDYENIIAYEHGIALPVNGHEVILNRGLELNDNVLMMRVLNGQNYIIISRLFQHS